MSDLLAIGLSGVRSYQTALATVSDNIANAATPGYVRRAATIGEVSGNRSGINSLAVQTGSGSVVTGIARQGDATRIAAVRTASADLAKTETGAAWLTRIQSALTGDQLGDRVTGFFTSATTLAGDPASATARAAMLEAASSAAAAFTATGRALDAAGIDLDTTADQATGQITALGQALAGINAGIQRTPPGTSAAANLLDQRDQLLDQIGTIADVDIQFDQLGRADVRMGGANGPALVSGTDSGSLTYLRNADGAVSFALHRGGATSTVSPAGGVLAGVADGAQRIQQATVALDGVATDFATAANGFQLNGYDANGKRGTAMLAVGAHPTELSLALTDPAGIAAAAAAGSPRDGSNLDTLQTARRTGGMEGALTATTAANAAALASRTTVADAQSSICDNAVAARDAGSAVDLDQEAVSLLRFQQAYAAAGRVIQVARDTFQSIIEIR